MSNVIEIQHLNKSYGNFPVFSDLNLSVKENSATALIGPNGCGKTTLIKSILGVTKVNKGEIYLFNSQVSLNGKTNHKHMTASRKKIGFIPDQNAFYDHLTTFEYLNLIFNLSITEYPEKKKDSIENIRRILKEFRLDRWSNRLIYTLSTGTKQKLAFAACLVHKPELLIMDEPFRGIDSDAHVNFVKYLSEFKIKGITSFGIQKPGSIFIASHILSDIEKICDNIVIMNEYGNIVLNGEINSVKERFESDKSFEDLLYKILNEEDELEQDDNSLSEDIELNDNFSD